MSAEQASLVAEIEAFITERGLAPSTFGRLAVNDGKFVGRLRKGGSLTMATADRVRNFMSGTIRPPVPESTSTLPAGEPDSVSHANDEAARRGDAPTVAPHRHSIPEAA